MTNFSHFDKDGRAVMVDVSDKTVTDRRATASGRVVFSAQAWPAVAAGAGPKGDIAAVAEIAGIMAAKKTSDLIPLCHPLPLEKISVRIEKDDAARAMMVTAEVRSRGRTGVEMEALTAVSVACLTIYDMTKAVDKSAAIEAVQLVEKSGGKSGDFRRGA